MSETQKVENQDSNNRHFHKTALIHHVTLFPVGQQQDIQQEIVPVVRSYGYGH